MALIRVYIQTPRKVKELFESIRTGQAPKKFTIQHLKDIGLTSSNHRVFIPLLKALRFLSEDGAPTKRYHDYRNKSISRRVMAEAMRDAYGDLFTIKEHPKKDNKGDREAIRGKFKSTHNISDRLAELMAGTFYSLLELADMDSVKEGQEVAEEQALPPSDEVEDIAAKADIQTPRGALPDAPALAAGGLKLHYDIQIHLPPTRDVEIYNAIFKSLKEHLIV